LIKSVTPLLFVIAAVVVLALSGNLLSASPFVIAAQVAAVALAVGARRSFQKGTFRVSAAPASSSIIRRGPYRFVRHPMYSAALLFVWTAVVSSVSALTLAIGTSVTVVVAARVISEERLLRAECPEYADYMRSTKALVPFVL
jgi:protein-S-isoprenylcysteine O-methyltransferase Ste14